MKIKGHWLYIGRIRIAFETNWHNRPYAWWFNQKYTDGLSLQRRICIPFFTFDILRKK